MSFGFRPLGDEPCILSSGHHGHILCGINSDSNREDAIEKECEQLGGFPVQS